MEINSYCTFLTQESYASSVKNKLYILLFQCLKACSKQFCSHIGCSLSALARHCTAANLSHSSKDNLSYLPYYHSWIFSNIKASNAAIVSLCGTCVPCCAGMHLPWIQELTNCLWEAKQYVSYFSVRVSVSTRSLWQFSSDPSSLPVF